MPESKELTLIYCGDDGAAAKKLADTTRLDGNRAVLVDAFMFDGERELCQHVVIMSDVPNFRAVQIRDAYGLEHRTFNAQPEPLPRKRGRPRKEITQEIS